MSACIESSVEQTPAWFDEAAIDNGVWWLAARELIVKQFLGTNSAISLTASSLPSHEANLWTDEVQPITEEVHPYTHEHPGGEARAPEGRGAVVVDPAEIRTRVQHESHRPGGSVGRTRHERRQPFGICRLRIRPASEQRSDALVLLTFARKRERAIVVPVVDERRISLRVE